MPVSPSGTVAIEGIIAVLIPLAKAVGLGVVDEFAIVSKDNITITTADRRQTDRQSETLPTTIIQRVGRVRAIGRDVVLASYGFW